MCLGRCVVRGLPSVVRGRTLSEPPQSSRSRQARQPSAGPERPVSSRGGRRLPGLAGRSGQDPERMHAGRGGELSEHQARAREAMFRVRPVGRAAAVRPRWNQGHGDRWTGPAGPHDQDERWEVARRLLNDPSIPTEDRVAGLLVLLYAQTASSIHRLTTDRVTRDEDHVLIHLGDRPIRLPAPLDKLMLELVASRATDTLIRHEGTGSSRDGRQDGQSTSRSCSDGSALTESGPARDAAPRCSRLPGSCPRGSCPRCSASTSAWPSPGSVRAAATGWDTPPMSPPAPRSAPGHRRATTPTSQPSCTSSTRAVCRPVRQLPGGTGMRRTCAVERAVAPSFSGPSHQRFHGGTQVIGQCHQRHRPFTSTRAASVNVRSSVMNFLLSMSVLVLQPQLV